MSGTAKEIKEIVEDIAARITTPGQAAEQAARTHLNSLTKPLGSLGRLEDIAAHLFAIRNGPPKLPMKKAVYVFAADHGIAAEGVSAYPSEVTHQMVLNFLAGGAAINVLARLHDADLHVIDVGVDADFADDPRLLHRKVRKGTRNMLHEPAMSDAEMANALSTGVALAHHANAEGVTLLAVGEMGIGNTTATSAITAAITHRTPLEVTGRGTGLNDEARLQKVKVIEAILERHRGESSSDDPLNILRGLGGLEIAAMTGMILAAASHRMAVILDGFISTAAATIACALAPAIRGYLFAGHRSQEPGHTLLLEHIGLQPILDLQMRLGEGSGAVLAMPIIESAAHIYSEMATFSSAGVSGAAS